MARVARWTARRRGSRRSGGATSPRARARRRLRAAARARSGARRGIAAEAAPTRARCAGWASAIRGRSSSRAAAGRAGGGVRASCRRRAAGRDRRGDGLGCRTGWRAGSRSASRATRTCSGPSKLFAGVAFLSLAWRRRRPRRLRWGAGWAAPTFLVGVATGYVALRFEELRRETAEAWRLVVLRAFHHQTRAAGRAPPRARRRGAAACATPTRRTKPTRIEMWRSVRRTTCASSDRQSA